MAAPTLNECPENRQFFTSLPTLAELGLSEPDPVAEHIDEHRRLIRYDQRAVNQIRKAARIKK